MKFLKKFVPIIVIMSLLMSFVMPIRVFAAEQKQEVKIDEKEFTRFSDKDGLLGALDGILGILLWIPRALFAVTIIVGETVVSQVIMEGQTDEARLDC